MTGFKGKGGNNKGGNRNGPPKGGNQTKKGGNWKGGNQGKFGGKGGGNQGRFGGKGGGNQGRFGGKGGGGFKKGKGGQGGGGRGKGAGGGGPKKNKVVVVPHRFPGVYLVKGPSDILVTKNLSKGESVYGEKRYEVFDEMNEKIEYRVWNPFRSKLGACLMGGVGNMPIKPGSKVLYLGAASGTSVSHVSDMIGQEGVVYAVEFSHRSGRDLTNVAKTRTNIVPIIEDARQPMKYRMLVDMVDVIFADVAQPDQARIVALNAEMFLKAGGWFIISIKANCIDSTVKPEVVFANEMDKLKKENCKPKEKLTLEPFHRNHAIVLGVYR